MYDFESEPTVESMLKNIRHRREEGMCEYENTVQIIFRGLMPHTESGIYTPKFRSHGLLAHNTLLTFEQHEDQEYRRYEMRAHAHEV